MEKVEVADLVSHLTRLLDLYPLDDLEAVKAKESDAMVEGLAVVYSNQGLRSYVENSRRIAQRNLIAVDSKDPVHYALLSTYYKSRIDTLTSLLVNARESFKHVSVKMRGNQETK